MTQLTDAQREFLANPFVGVVTDLRPDGSPHSTIVWVDVDDEGVSFNTAHGRAKPTYIARDGRVALTIVDPQDPYRWLSVSGTAKLVDEGADAQIDRLAKKYVGKDTYPFRQPGERRVTVRIVVEKIDGRGFDAPE
ncbi:MAG: PPOX class F420-dependent oxidoreductase [Thermoleophilia bacterium]|nr:PPOX class F420-dependent oxidoreductase [Thermoleophilia bacterium]